jgi:hypothetical protein
MTRPEDRAVLFTGDSDTAGIDLDISSPWVGPIPMPCRF